MTVDNFLLVADPYQDSLYQINVVNDSIWRLPVRRQQFSHVAYDPVEGNVYWRVGSTITRAYLDGTAEEYFAGACSLSISKFSLSIMMLKEAVIILLLRQ